MSLLTESKSFTLPNFEGPLSFLLYLVQKSEVDLSEISLTEITEQYIKFLSAHPQKDVNDGGEFIDNTSSLLWLKSKLLLPHQSNDPEDLQLAEGSPFDIIPQLLEYCQFKKVAKHLGERETAQQGYYTRGVQPTEGEPEKPLGIEHVGVEELAVLFSDLMARADARQKVIKEEAWRVADKVRIIRQLLKRDRPTYFLELFSESPSKVEVIVCFLAMLELMKLGEVKVIKETETGRITLNP